MDFTSQERIRANVCFEQLSCGWNPEAAHELIILFKDKPSTHWGKGIIFPTRKKKDFMTGHTSEIGDVTISQDDVGPIDVEDEKIERIGNYKVEFRVVENRTFGAIRFSHFWASVPDTAGSECPTSYFVMYINFTELICIKFLRADYIEGSIPWRYYGWYWFMKFFHKQEAVLYQPQLTILYQNDQFPWSHLSRWGLIKLRAEYWYLVVVGRIKESFLDTFFRSRIGRLILGSMYLIIMFKLTVWIGMLLFRIHPIIPLGLNALLLIGGFSELKSSKEKGIYILSILFYSSTMVIFLIASYRYYVG